MTSAAHLRRHHRQAGMVTSGNVHTCGETTTNRAYCWGSNVWGQLGDGTNTQRLTPGAVADGHFFSQVGAGELHPCGRTDAGVAYCWGNNIFGRLGDGTTEKRSSPIPVAGPR
jgi:alpha-tubulin suppressor-like RCC1 family protein